MVGTWYPELKRWSLFYRPKDMLQCNTNNGVERLNRSLKYEHLDGNKCSLSTLIEEIVFRFIPKLQQNYLELNVA